MPDFFFPDNTVLVNFAHIQRMDLLKKLLNGKGKWCATVAQECDRSSNVSGLATMKYAQSIFGEPLYPENQVEYLHVVLLRGQITQPYDPPEKSLGEAETLAIMSRRFMAGYFITDDKEAARLARQNNITVVSTWDLLKLAVNAKLVDVDTLWGYVQTLGTLGRGAPIRVSDRISFDEWLQ